MTKTDCKLKFAMFAMLEKLVTIFYKQTAETPSDQGEGVHRWTHRFIGGRPYHE